MSIQAPQLNWFFKRFENCENTHVLKVISRLVGVSFLLISAFFTDNVNYLLTFFAGGIIAMDLLFFIIGKKNSHYKTAAVFQDLQATPESMDKYNKILLIIKSLSFILVMLAPPLIFAYGILCLVIAPIVGNEVNFGSWVGEKKKTKSALERDVEMFSGVSGYNTVGMFTGSETARGGFSS